MQWRRSFGMWLLASLFATCIPSRNFMGGARTWQLRACRRVHLLLRLHIRSLLAVFLLNFVFFPHGRRPYWRESLAFFPHKRSTGAFGARWRCPWLISRASAPERGHRDLHWRLVPASWHARVGSKKLRIALLPVSSSHCETASDNDNKGVGASRSMDCQARTGSNNDGAGNPRNIPCNHAGLAWSTFPRPSLSQRSIALSLAEELHVLSQDGYGSNAYI